MQDGPAVVQCSLHDYVLCECVCKDRPAVRRCDCLTVYCVGMCTGTDLRCGGVSWGDGNLALVYESWWKTRRSIIHTMAPDRPQDGMKVSTLSRRKAILHVAAKADTDQMPSHAEGNRLNRGNSVFIQPQWPHQTLRDDIAL